MKPGNSGKVRILVVDDSAFMRKALTMMLESDPQIEVVGTARDGHEGVEKARLLKPDLVTMDIEMPRMDGLTALREIMSKNPIPVMMISSISTEGAQATLDALEMGAVDFIPKQSSYVSLDIVKIRDELLAKIKDIVRRKSILMSRFRLRGVTGKRVIAKDHRRATAVDYTQVKATRKRNHPVSVIAIGSSTGGPLALQSVIPKLPRNLPVGIVIAQHMPPTFTKSLADRLNSLSQVTVIEASGGERIEPGCVYIAPGGRHMTVRRSGASGIVAVTDSPSDTLYKPCVDVLLNSVAQAYGRTTLGVMLTGMGTNGVNGARLIRSQGGVLIAQNEESCVVYGMPRAVIEADLANHIQPIERIASEIVSYF